MTFNSWSVNAFVRLLGALACVVKISTISLFSALKSAKEIHDELESCYIEAMNFDKVEEIRKELSKRIWESEWYPEE